MRVLGCVVAVAVVLANVVFAPATALAAMANLGFELGNLDEWTPTVSPGGRITPTLGPNHLANNGDYIGPHSGSWFVVLVPGAAEVPTRLSRTFSVAADDTVSGYALFDAEWRTDDYGNTVYNNDHAEIVIRLALQPDVIIRQWDVAAVGAKNNTGWVFWEHRFPAAGDYVLEARVTNAVDQKRESRLCLDSVTTSAMPKPTAEAGGPYTVPEGGALPLVGAGVSPSGAIKYEWDLNGVDGFEIEMQNPVFRADGMDGPGAAVVRLRVTDTVSGLSAIDSADISITNVAPMVFAGQDQEIDLGGYSAATATFSDPGNDTWTATVDYGYVVAMPDGTERQVTETRPVNRGDIVVSQHLYPRAGEFLVTVTVTDDDGGVGVDDAWVNVIGPNGLPEFLSPPPGENPTQYVAEGDTLVLSIVATDPESAPVTLLISGLPEGAEFPPAGGLGNYRYGSTLTWTTDYDDGDNCPPDGYPIDVMAYDVATENITEETPYALLHFHIIVQNLDVQYTINAVAGEGGAIAPEGAVLVNIGDSQSFEISTDEGYHIADLLVDGVSAGTVDYYAFEVVTADHSIQAIFAVDTFIITVGAGPNGAISPDGAVTVEYGKSQAFTVTPATGYHIADVLVDGASIGAATSYTFADVRAAHTIGATFAINTYTITATAGAHGAVSPAGVVTLNYGAVQTFDFTPEAGYQVDTVLVDGAIAGPTDSYTFSNVDRDHTIEVTFAIESFSVTASAGPNGSISPAGVVSVTYGGNQSFAIAANTGYHVDKVLVDGVNVGAVTGYTFSNVAASHTIEALFAIDSFTITANAGTNGSISPAGAVTVNYGATQSFTITPNTGYHVASVTVDGATVGPVTGYTFSDVMAAHTISATFAIDTFIIAAGAGPNGSISPVGAVTVNYGATQAFTITPADGFEVADMMVDTVSKGPLTGYTFTNVTANHSISVTFTETLDLEAGLLIKHLHINWDMDKDGGHRGDDDRDGGRKDHDDGDDDHGDECRGKYAEYLDLKLKYGDDHQKTLEKFNEFVSYMQKYDKSGDDADAKNRQKLLTAYSDYQKLVKKYGEKHQKTRAKLTEYLAFRNTVREECAPPKADPPRAPLSTADFHVQGRIRLPEGVTVNDLEKAAVLTLAISSGEVTDEVVFTRGNGKDGTQWVYRGGGGNLNGVGLNVEKMTVWWAPANGRWAGYAGFHINGELEMPAGINGATQPPVVTVTVQLPQTSGPVVVGEATVECQVSGQNSVWQYNAHTGWPQFPYEVTD